MGFSNSCALVDECTGGDVPAGLFPQLSRLPRGADQLRARRRILRDPAEPQDRWSTPGAHPSQPAQHPPVASHAAAGGTLPSESEPFACAN